MQAKLLLLIYTLAIALLVIRLIFGLKIETREPVYVQKTVQSVPNSLITYYTNFLPEHEAALVVGMIFGQKAELTYAQKSLLQKAGLTHVIVASGMNLVFLIGLLDFLCLKIGSLRLRAMILLAAVLFYCFLTGFEPPIVRAGIMCLSVSLASLIGRPRMAYWGLILAAYLLIMMSPSILTSISFQLSFLATTAQIYLGKLQIHVPILSKFALETFWQTIFTQLFTLPIILSNFGVYPGGAIIANFLALWTIPWIMSLGLGAGIIGLASNIIGKIAFLPTHALAYYFWKIVEIVGNQENILLRVGSIDLTVSLAYYLLLFVLILWSERQMLKLADRQNIN